MYFRRSDLILPRTICLNRLASRSIFRTTAVWPSPLEPACGSDTRTRNGGLSGGSPRNSLRMPGSAAVRDPVSAVHRAENQKIDWGKTDLETIGRGGSRTIRSAFCPVVSASDPGCPLANCIPRPRKWPRAMRGRFLFSSASIFVDPAHPCWLNPGPAQAVRPGRLARVPGTSRGHRGSAHRRTRREADILDQRHHVDEVLHAVNPAGHS